MNVESKKSRWVINLVLMLASIVWLFPIFVMFKESLRVNGFENYIATLQNPNFPTFVFNSFFVAFFMIIISITILAFAAFAFSKLEFAGKRLLFNMVLAGLMLPVASMIVPLFFTLRSFDGLNNHWGLIGAEVAFFLPFGLMLIKGYFDELPNELMEAAYIDGATILEVFFKVMLPLAKPALATALIYAFLNSWNEYLMVLTFMTDPAYQTVTMAPSFFKDALGGDPGKIYASLVLISLPTMVFYIFFQRFFQKGMTAGAVK
ncbi:MULTISPECIES: carbohydrate ABC transporter permease [Exiguobacterium]|uniref:carbohydrate ABC transporter permease n=1 Tax=Exiguobacterium TaxID=33986 RepID=UPI00047B8AF7|nr:MULTISPECIES: carbohydrate ABC transporter permease [Exiguobacterium]MCK2158411.1 carbohydrate ABC transporter permease [Exiguobacterium sp. 17-1]MDW2884710.1 carbohydrate ABC transporter permease [Exiguobacterium sibiricum]MDX1260968.1 carbohydrate ABC transporter permease [Exiguobacterium sp. K1]QNR20026.1 carbohydrate ABC transporter permease [Exiguobacterium sp. Helios]RDB32545.1 carbohydrate ABC transporter permease [Exiguobacterium sp. RIT594]